MRGANRAEALGRGEPNVAGFRATANGVSHVDTDVDSATDGTVARAHDERALSGSAIAKRYDGEEDLIRARTAVDGLASSLRADGADLVLTTFEDGVLEGELRIGDLTCDDGSCIMPADALARMIEALVRPHVPALRSVALRERKLVK